MLKKLLETFFPDILEGLEKEAFQKGKRQAEKEQRENREFIQVLELEYHLNKPVMAFSNEFEDPVVGITLRVDLITQGRSPVLVVHDYVSNKEVTIMGVVTAYHEEFLEKLLAIDPCVRLALLYRTSYNNPYPSTVEKYNRYGEVTLSTYEEIKEKLSANGFYDRLTELNLNKM